MLFKRQKQPLYNFSYNPKTQITQILGSFSKVPKITKLLTEHFKVPEKNVDNTVMYGWRANKKFPSKKMASVAGLPNDLLKKLSETFKVKKSPTNNDNNEIHIINVINDLFCTKHYNCLKKMLNENYSESVLKLRRSNLCFAAKLPALTSNPLVFPCMSYK